MISSTFQYIFQIETIEGVLALVEELEQSHESGTLDLPTALSSFRRMERDYPTEYRGYELPHIASTVVAPLLKRELAGWAVLDAPFKHKAAFAEWREILACGDSGEQVCEQVSLHFSGSNSNSNIFITNMYLY